MFRRSHVFVFALIVLVGVGATMTPAYAQLGLFTHPVNEFFAFATGAGFTIARVFISLTVFALRMFMEVAGYNGYIDAPPVLVGWYMVRDIANMGFVVALLAIAFGTILGLEQYEWKKSLVKLILAAILINFSRLIIGIFIDASHIITITFLDAVQGSAGGNLIQMLKLEKIMQISGAGGKDLASTALSDDLRYQLFASSVLAVIFSLMALVTIGAYLAVMIARVVVLWVLIIMSPLAFVLGAIPQAKSYADEFWKDVSKYIIVAPIMTFFLWLAFATLGNGDINNHVGIGASTAEQTQIYKQLQLSGAGQQVSLSKATTWENMSAFLIAIAFLFAGLDRVSKIGVVGGHLVSGALEFGKQSLEVATGITAARFARGLARTTAGKAIGLVAKKAPLVGGEALQRYGKIIGGGARAVKAGVDIKREEARQAAEKALEGKKGFGAFLGKAALFTADRIGLTESGARKNKRAENWQEAAKALEERREKEISTSKTFEGKMKTREQEALKIQVESKGAIEERKRAAAREKLVAEGGKFAKARGRMAEEKAGAETITGLEEATKAQQLEEARRVEREAQPEKLKKTGVARAETEQLELEKTREYEERVAGARDEYLKGKFRPGEAVFLANVRSKHAKEDAERQSIGDLDLARGRQKDQLGLIKARKTELSALGRDESTDAQLIQLQSDLALMGTANVGKGAAFGGATRDDLLATIDPSKKKQASVNLDDDSFKQLQANYLSSKLGEIVAPADVAKAFEKLKKILGKRADAILEEDLLRLNKSAGQGALGNAGLLIRKNGQVQLSNFTTDEDHIKSRRTNALSETKVTEIAGLGDSADTKDGNVVVDSNQSIEYTTDILAQVTANNSGKVNEYTLLDINSIVNNSGENKVSEFIRMLREKNTDKRAVLDLLTKVQAKGGAHIARLDMAIAELTATSVPAGRGGAGGAAGGGGGIPPPPIVIAGSGARISPGSRPNPRGGRTP